jgi:hypothetical protein
MFESNPFPVLWHFAREWWFAYEIVLALFIVGTLLERRWPVEHLQSRAATRLNLAYSAISTAFGRATRPLTAAASVWTVKAA